MGCRTCAGYAASPVPASSVSPVLLLDSALKEAVECRMRKTPLLLPGVMAVVL